MIQISGDSMFDEQAVLSRVQNLWMQLRLAWSSENLAPLKVYFSSSLYEKFENELRQVQRIDRIHQDVRPAILSSSLSYEGIRNGREILTCNMLTRYRPTEVKKQAGATPMGGQETFYRETWALGRPEGTLTPAPGHAFSVHCAQCGAALSLYKSAQCPFCGNLARVPDFTWTVENISQVRELHP